MLIDLFFLFEETGCQRTEFSFPNNSNPYGWSERTTHVEYYHRQKSISTTTLFFFCFFVDIYFATWNIQHGNSIQAVLILFFFRYNLEDVADVIPFKFSLKYLLLTQSYLVFYFIFFTTATTNTKSFFFLFLIVIGH